jgi:hypothetical protein
MHQFVREQAIGTPNVAMTLQIAMFVACGLLVSACGGGSDSGGSSKPGGGGDLSPVNTAPVANAGADQSVSEFAVVDLAGSGTDAEGDALTFSWSQTSGIPVVVADASSAQASFTAPDVAIGVDETLMFELSVSDGSATSTDTVTVTVYEPSGVVRVFGRVNYEFVPPNASCRGLDFDNTMLRPIRGATVQLIDANTLGVLAQTQSSTTGEYSFPGVDNDTTVRLRVRAELKKTSGTSRWDVDVRDNVDTTGSPPPLSQRPLYVIESSDFDTGATDVNRNFTATSGWAGAAYDEPRAAAPFAILDAIYSAMQFVLAADPAAVFGPLDAFWSVNNTLASPTDIDAGELGASFYRSDINSLFLLGDATVDTEEFDDHVIVHEWGHYFEDNFSRSDSFGGPHAIGDRIDPRLAFGEGWATALAAMALDNQLYCDTSVPGTAGGFGIGAESGSYNARGWYDEISVLRFIYDMWDDVDDGGGSDTVSVGFGPIYEVMTGPQAYTEAFTTVFSFATELRAALSNTADQAGLDAQLARADITAAGLDIWGSNELNTAGGAPDVMPIYTDITADGSERAICFNSQFDDDRDGNKLSEDRYLRISVPVTDEYDVEIRTTTPTPVTDDPDDRDQSDPDIYIFRGPQFITAGTGPDDNAEIFRTPVLAAGQTYIAAIEEWRFDDEDAASSYPDRICMTVSMTPTP